MQTQSEPILTRVIAAVVDDRQLTLYKEDGETVVILQGDDRLAKIIKVITPILASGPGAVAEVDLEEPKDGNPYKDYQEQTKTGIRFFKVAKHKLSSWLVRATEVMAPSGAIIIPPMTLGAVPAPKVEPTKGEILLLVAQEVIKHAQPVAHPEFHDRDTGDKGDQTIVAIVGDKVVANVEKLKPQFKRAVQTSSTKGMDAFMQRVAAVSDQRRHSVDDLLKFLQRGDLPIADDGCIIIYKVLKRVIQSPTRRGYVDCHTQKVSQQVGSYVCMDPSLVDPNRANECSNGLHVARRAYVGGFSGDVVVLAKVRPEDVIAVPNYDANKMRVCGYHILFELSDDAFQKLKKNQAFTDNEQAQLLLGRALTGDHDLPTEEVRIQGNQGQNVKITPWSELYPIKKAPKAEAPTIAPAIVKAEAVEALPDEVETPLSAPKVDPKAVVKEVVLVKAEVESRKQKALRLYDSFVNAKLASESVKAARELLEHKKTVKLSWQALGLDEKSSKLVLQTIEDNL